MALTVLNTDIHVAGNLSAQTQTLPAASVADAQVVSTAAIAYTKLEHEHCLNYCQNNGSNVASATVPLYIARGSGAVVQIDATITGVAMTGDRTITVDLQKGNAGGAYATVLTSTIGFSISDALRTVKTTTISSPNFVNDDSLLLVVTVAGTTGTQPQGLLVTVSVKELT